MMEQPKKLALSFWDIDLSNFPEGAFQHEKLTQETGAALVNGAIASNTLSVFSDTDFLAPYHEREKDKHAELCRVLKENLGVDISLKMFTSEFKDEDGARRYHVNPLQVYQLSPDCPLLVVTCHYVWNRSPSRDDLGLDVSPESVAFHLFSVSDFSE